MNCMNCGNALRPELKFCPQCGTPAPQPAPYAPPPEQVRTSWSPPAPQAAPASPQFGAPPRRKSRAGKILLVVLGVFLLLAAGAGVAVYYGVRYFASSVKSSEPYLVAERHLRESPVANNTLGDIKSTGFPIGSFNAQADGSGQAAYTMTVEGTRASGRYSAVLEREQNHWQIKTAVLNMPNGEVVSLVAEEGEVEPPAEGGEDGPPPPPAPPGVGAAGRVNVPGAVSAGPLDDKATSKPEPTYPRLAQAARAGGQVVVRVVVDERGQVIMANAVSGHPLLQPAAVAAARRAEFEPTVSGGKPVKVVGTLTYEFEPQ
jgi:TonB family protein